MSSKTPDSNPDAEQDQPADSDATHPTEEANPLQIALPDGSASVSDAIVTHREMLRDPQEHGLATEQDVTHLSEAIESLSANITETSQEHDESRSRIEDLQDIVEQQRGQIEDLQEVAEQQRGQIEDLQEVAEQQRGQIEDLQGTVEHQRGQIDELQSMVTSLAGILGTETEWETFEEE
jgi:chromosome segregation ATPase